MIRALPGAGQTCAQFPHPVQSSGVTPMLYFNVSSLFNALAGTNLTLSGALLASSSFNKNGLIAAWGHTNAHWLHCIHFDESHSGTLTATPLFSYAEVPCMNVPSSIPSLKNVETGILSPSCLFIGTTISLINAGISLAAAFSSWTSSFASFHEEGTSILTIEFIPVSIASWFMLTTFSPFFPYDLTTASFKYLTASSNGIMSAILKNADCIIILILPPRPISCAILTAFNV